MVAEDAEHTDEHEEKKNLPMKVIYFQAKNKVAPFGVHDALPGQKTLVALQTF